MNQTTVSDNPNLAEMGRQWMSFNRYSLKKSSLATYGYVFEKHIEPSLLAVRPIDEITPEDIVNYSQDLLDAKLSPSSVNSVLIEIRSIFKFAEIMYGCTPPYVKYVKEAKRETRVLSVAEQNRLDAYLRASMDNFHFGIFFALYTGVRVGELCALRWEDVRDGAVKITKTMHRLSGENGGSAVTIGSPKTPSSNRIIPLPDFLNRMLESRRRSPEEFFLSGEKIGLVEPRLMQTKFKLAAKECGIEGATFHTLRHTFATRCIECGCDPKTLSELLGHSDVKTTLNRYVHSSFERKKNCMNLLTKIAG